VLSVVDLLYYLISKRVLWLKKQFVGMGSGEVRKGALEIKITRQGTLCLDPTSLKRKMSKRREEAASNIIPVIYRKRFATLYLSFQYIVIIFKEIHFSNYMLLTLFNSF
jgi:hypothetical protein